MRLPFWRARPTANGRSLPLNRRALVPVVVLSMIGGLVAFAVPAAAAGETITVNLTATDGRVVPCGQQRRRRLVGHQRHRPHERHRHLPRRGGRQRWRREQHDVHRPTPAGRADDGGAGLLHRPGQHAHPGDADATGGAIDGDVLSGADPAGATCNVGNRTSGSTFTYPVTAKVRSELPNGHALTVTAAATSDAVTTPVVSQPVTTTVSSALKFDLSKNGVSVQPDSGARFGPVTAPCTSDPTNSPCYRWQFPITLSAPNTGKGAEPATSPITFTDDLSPASLWTSLSGADLSAISANLAKYGARLVECPTTNTPYNVPGYRIAGVPDWDASKSVRDQLRPAPSPAVRGRRCRSRSPTPTPRCTRCRRTSRRSTAATARPSRPTPATRSRPTSASRYRWPRSPTSGYWRAALVR